MKIQGDMIGRIRKRSRATENVVLKGTLKSTEFAVELLKRERDALRAIVKGQKRELLWKNAVLVLALAVYAGVAVVLVGRRQGWW